MRLCEIGAAHGTLRDRLARKIAGDNPARLLARVFEIAHRVAARPELDPRTPDEILGYDDYGIPR